jgi:2-oxoglutarate ferredoxin oxidoreductase subunit alpha
VSLGGCDPAMREAVTLFEKKGVKVDYMRVRGFPFDQAVEDFLDSHPVNYIVEQNRDGQLRTLLLTETAVAKEKLQSVLFYGGFPLSARQVVDAVSAKAGLVIPAAAAAPSNKPGSTELAS